jgi:hypothetical protein
MQAFQKLKRRLTSEFSGVPPWGDGTPVFNDRKGKEFLSNHITTSFSNLLGH